MTKPKYKVWEKVVARREEHWYEELNYWSITKVMVRTNRAWESVIDYNIWPFIWSYIEGIIKKPTKEELELYYIND